MEKKIIFFDVDGTLYTNELGGITDNVKKAIAATRALGHLCFVASGRPYGYIADNVKDIGFDGYVLANGANIKYQNHDLEKRFLNYKDVKELCQKLKEKNIEYVLQTSTVCCLDRNSQCLLDFYKKCNIDFENFCFDYDEEDVLRLLNIDIKDSYCFGDGPNDVEMFETVGHAIAMGNAIDIIKERAESICLTVHEDGVAHKLKELFDL